MLNKQTVMTMASRFLPQEKVQLLSQAYDMANKITDMTSNPKEALEKAGVTRQDVEKAKQLLNNPMANLFLGDKKQSVLEGLNKAESLFSSQTEQTPVSELEQLQRTLATLK